MTIFATTESQRAELYKIAAEMNKEGLPPTFVATAVKIAETEQGTFEMMQMWWEHREDRGVWEEIIKAIQEEIDEHQRLLHQKFKEVTEEANRVGDEKVDVPKEKIEEITDEVYGQLQQSQQLRLSDKDFELLTAKLEDAPEPNEALRKLLRS